MIALLRCFSGVLQVDVDGFVAAEGSHVRGDLPVEIGGKESSRLGKKLFEVAGVVDLAGTNLPGGAKSGREIVVDAAELEFAHAVHGTLIDYQLISDCAGRVVKGRG